MYHSLMDIYISGFPTGSATRLPQEGSRGAASRHIYMDIRPILTTRSSAKYFENKRGCYKTKKWKNTDLDITQIQSQMKLSTDIHKY